MKCKMSSTFNSYTKDTLLANHRGVALPLVMGAITILIYLLFEFTLETKINLLKIRNQSDRYMARLNAESGLAMALSRLDIYAEARNTIDKNGASKSVPVDELENFLISPFYYPIPLDSKAGLIQKSAKEEFEKKTVIRGEIRLNVSKISGMLNPNSLRIVEDKKSKLQNINSEFQTENNLDSFTTTPPPKEDEEDNKKKLTPKWDAAKKMFLTSLAQIFDDKNRNDEAFHSKYSNLSPSDLVAELAVYVNDRNKQMEDLPIDEARNRFLKAGIMPKYGPMTTIEEIRLLPSWDESLVNLLIDRFSVHELSNIPINELKIDDLKVLFPKINNIQIEEFFKYRDGDEDKKIRGQKFQSAEDFKNAVVNKLNIVSDTEFEEMTQNLKSAGLTIDVASNLYKIYSEGIYENAKYKITAIVSIPLKVEEVKKNSQLDIPGNPAPVSPTNPAGQAKDTNKETKSSFQKPRVVEIRVE